MLRAIDVFFVQPILGLLILVVFINVVLSWLMAFDIVNRRNQVVGTVGRVTEAILAPLLSPIRRILPFMGGVDFSPFVLLLIVYFLKDWLAPTLLG